MSDVAMCYPCDMGQAYLGDSWQDHRDRQGYLAQGWEPGTDILSRGQYKIPLVAVLGGKVSRDKDVGYNDGYGTYVEIDHGLQADGHRYKSLYAHMDGNITKVGQVVKAGEQIGVMGSTGNSNVVHVHFILWRDGKNVDSMPFLMAQPVIPPPVTPPVVTPPGPPIPLGNKVMIGADYNRVGLRCAPNTNDDSLIRRISGSDGFVFERMREVTISGRTWVGVMCYIAKDYLENA